MQEIIDEGRAVLDENGRPVPAEGYNESQLRKEMEEYAEAAVVQAHEPERFLLTTNIFMPDTWANPIPTVDVFSNTGIGKLGITDVDKNEYELMKPLKIQCHWKALERVSDVYFGVYIIYPAQLNKTKRRK